MMETKFVVSECGNTPDEAWDRTVGNAYVEDYTKKRPHGGVLDKKGFKLIGKIPEGANVHKAALEIVENHKESHPDNENALCIDAGNGEYYFIGKSFKE